MSGSSGSPNSPDEKSVLMLKRNSATRGRSNTIDSLPPLDLKRTTANENVDQHGKAKGGTRDERAMLLSGLVSPRRKASVAFSRAKRASIEIKKTPPPPTSSPQKSRDNSPRRAGRFGRLTRSETAPAIVASRRRGQSSTGLAASKRSTLDLVDTYTGYPEVIWAQVKRDVEEIARVPDGFLSDRTGRRSPKTRDRGRRRGSGSFTTRDEGAQGVRPSDERIPLRRGAMAVIFELEYCGNRRVMYGYCQGRCGPFLKSDVKLMREAVDVPKGNDPADWKKLLVNALPVDNYGVLKEVLKCVPKTQHKKAAKWVTEIFKLKELDPFPLLRHLVKEELMLITKQSMFFRGNSIQSKIMSEFTRQVGHKYLRSIINPLLRMLKFQDDSTMPQFEKPPEQKTEARLLEDEAESESVSMMDFLAQADPEAIYTGDTESRAEKEARFERNYSTAGVLWQSTSFVLSLITESWDVMPNFLKMTGRTIHQMTSMKFEHTRVILGGYLLLRFIVPALSAPAAFGFDISGLTRLQLKHMVHISKCLQCISNDQLFKSRDGMDLLNDRLPEATQLLNKFYSRFEEELHLGDDSQYDCYHVSDVSELDASLMQELWESCRDSLPTLAQAANMKPADAVESVRLSSLLDVITGVQST